VLVNGNERMHPLYIILFWEKQNERSTTLQDRT
jgi:hypothetical protein